MSSAFSLLLAMVMVAGDNVASVTVIASLSLFAQRSSCRGKASLYGFLTLPYPFLIYLMKSLIQEQADAI